MYSEFSPDATQATDHTVEDDQKATLTERFLAFHKANPRVYTVLRELARDYLARGKRKIGIELLWNVARWQLSLEIEGEDTYELNNDFKSFYARALMRFEQDLTGLFDLRRAPEADAWIATYQDEAAA